MELSTSVMATYFTEVNTSSEADEQMRKHILLLYETGLNISVHVRTNSKGPLCEVSKEDIPNLSLSDSLVRVDWGEGETLRTFVFSLTGGENDY